MKKKLLLAGVAALSIAALASCGKKNDKPTRPSVVVPQGTTTEVPTVDSYDTNKYYTGKTIKMYINYKGKSGISYTGKESKLGTSYTNPIDGATYKVKDKLPMWNKVQDNLGCTIEDAVWNLGEYSQADDKAVYTYLTGNSVGDTGIKAGIDVMMTSTTYAPQYASKGVLVNLADYFDVMPNLHKFLQEHPSVYAELTDADGKMYIAPYFDGIDTIEKMFLFNTEVVKTLLDEDSNYDTAEIESDKAGAYTAFIDTSKDYKILISDNGVAKDLTVKASKNPVTRQNELATKNGRNYVQALKDYIDEAYMKSGEYENRSDVFISEKACYSTDDLIALMRCVVNNSVLLTGEAGKAQGIVPRGDKKSRVKSILQFAQIWGVRGLTAEKDMLYFDNESKLHDARTTEATYDALTRLHQLKQEGLILDGFDAETKKADTTYHGYLNGSLGVTLMMYDYNATQAVNNKLDEETGIGVKDSKYNGIMPVLPPVTYWEENYINASDYYYTRYSEDGRAFKAAGSVVIDSGNADQIKAACQVVDYFYGTEGSKLQDYGTAEYQDGTVTIAGVVYPKLKKELLSAISKSGLGWNDYMRDVIGNTQGMGHVRTDGLDYQVTHKSGQVGLNNVLNAVRSGALVVATTARPYGFGATVPSNYGELPSTDEIQTLVDFWAEDMGDTGWRSVVNHGWEGSTTTKDALQAQWDKSNDIYLKKLNDYLDFKTQK